MEGQIKQTNPTLHRYLFTVTPFSKYLAMLLFILLPFVGFYLGMKYQQKITFTTQIIPEKNYLSLIPIITPKPVDTSSWRTYTRIVPADKTPYYDDPQFKITMEYPPDWTLKEFHSLSNRVVDNPAEINTAVFTGKEGKITLEWGPMGFGGGCDPSNHLQIRIKNTAVDVCHFIESDGSENWSFIGDPNKNQPAEANATVYAPYIKNSPVIKTIISTLAFN